MRLQLLVFLFLLAFGSFFLSGCSVKADPATGKYTFELDWSAFTRPNKKKTDVCGISNCHGAEVTCGVPVEMCTMEYALGDFCREFASCYLSNGYCELEKEPEFDSCISCVKKCQELDAMSGFECENECRSQFL